MEYAAINSSVMIPEGQTSHHSYVAIVACSLLIEAGKEPLDPDLEICGKDVLEVHLRLRREKLVVSRERLGVIPRRRVPSRLPRGGPETTKFSRRRWVYIVSHGQGVLISLHQRALPKVFIGAMQGVEAGNLKLL
jgi:hypothetical protein